MRITYEVDVGDRCILTVTKRVTDSYTTYDADPSYWLDPETRIESLNLSFQDTAELGWDIGTEQVESGSKRELTSVIEHMTAPEKGAQVPLVFARVLGREIEKKGRRVRWRDEQGGDGENDQEHWRRVLKRLEMT